MKKVKSLQPGLRVKHVNPTFDIEFKDDRPVEVEDEVAEELLKNPTFILAEESAEKEAKKRKSSFTKLKKGE